MRVKDVIDENYQDYKLPSMMIATCNCDWKCLIENGLDISICQNSAIAKQENIEVSINYLCDRYLSNPLTKSIILGGLEPFLQFDDLFKFILTLRFEYDCNDDIVIYTGYYPDELKYELQVLCKYNNIVVKFGRFIPNDEKVYDDVLGIYLNSSNQFAKRIS